MAERGVSRVVRGLKEPRLESLFIATILLYPFFLGTQPIADNSMLTHMRTGIDMVAGSGIPRVDPYSWTAAGDPWVVQSWLPEWTYGLAHRLGGYSLVVLEQALLVGLLGWLIVRLARAGTPLRTALGGIVVIGIAARFLTPRPLLFGLICMALVVTIVERKKSPWLLVPVVWFWVQCHGSFPLGLAWLVAIAAGQWLDHRARPHQSLRYIGAFVVGLAVSVLNPLGARLLTFPLKVGEKQAIFEKITEWKSPDFQARLAQFALVFLALGLIFLLRSRLRWREVLPVVLFLVAALFALRNIAVFAVVLAPVLGRVLRPADSPASAPTAASPVGSRGSLNRVVAAGLFVLYLVMASTVFDRPPLNLDRFPKAAVAYLNEEGLQQAPHRLANQDFVGNYLIFRFGKNARVFIDDRFDMYPLPISLAFLDLLGGGNQALRVLDDYQVDVVLWDRSAALPALLRATGMWQTRFEDEKWVILEREKERSGPLRARSSP